jgi:hypothetical protein
MDKHPHRDMLARIGPDRVKSHFRISRQTLWQWGKTGVPPMFHNSIRLLALVNGVQVPEMDQETAG